jgi:hypothetical protein
MGQVDHWEPMPGWYVELSDVARDEGAPETVRLCAAAAIQYVDDLRRDHKRLRAVEQRARELAAKDDARMDEFSAGTVFGARQVLGSDQSIR